jgi:tRNA (guanine37-N1)-methyltransferase
MFGMTKQLIGIKLTCLMLSCYVLTVHPEFIRAYSSFGALRAAQTKGLARIDPIALRDYAVDRHGSIDDHPYGGGDGMVLRPEPLAAAINALPTRPTIILTSPIGKRWTQQDAQLLAASERPLAFVCGRFAGVDQRFIDTYVDAEYSCGDVILTGGELPALMMIDSIVRLLPGALGNPKSAVDDSFSPGCSGGLEHALYTRPPVFEGKTVPEVLLSGDHDAIASWRKRDALERTRRYRPDLIDDDARPD